MKQAVILAGGKGTRLAAQLQGRPKCLVDVAGVPLLERQITLLKAHGFDDIVLLVNHDADQVERFLADKGFFGISIRLVDDGEPRGTSGAVLATFDALAERFLVVYGDTLMNIDLSRFYDSHAGSDATLFLHPNDHPHDSDLVETDDEGWIRAFHSYPHPAGHCYANLVNGALYVLEKAALEVWRGFKTPSDFGKDLFGVMLTKGQRLRGYKSFEYLKDIGTLERLRKAEEDIARGVVARASLAEKQKAVFLDRDGTLTLSAGHIARPEALMLFPFAADAVKLLNRNEYRAVLVTNQPVIARGEASFDDLRRIHAKLETELGAHGAFLDAIYVCPHHRDGGYAGEVAALKFDCACRKPKTGMIEQAVRDLNIDLSRSWLIGDTTRDVETAKRAGVKSVLVRTGEAGADGHYDAAPNYRAADAKAAVELVLRQGERP